MNFWKLLAAGVLAATLVLPSTADAKRKKKSDDSETPQNPKTPRV